MPLDMDLASHRQSQQRLLVTHLLVIHCMFFKFQGSSFDASGLGLEAT